MPFSTGFIDSLNFFSQAFVSDGSGNADVTSVDCGTTTDFICELDHLTKVSEVAEVDNQVFYKFFYWRVANYRKLSLQPTFFSLNKTLEGRDATTKQVIVSKIKKSFAEAMLSCKTFGMKLMSFDYEKEEKDLLEIFAESEIIMGPVYLAGTSMDSSYIYNVHNGKPIQFETDTVFEANRCLLADFHPKSGGRNYSLTDCSSKNFFMCQQYGDFLLPNYSNDPIGKEVFDKSENASVDTEVSCSG